MKILNNLLKKLLSKFDSIAYLVTKNLAVQQQLITLKRSSKVVKFPKIGGLDRRYA